MPSKEVRSTTWRRVGKETQEAEAHRVHAQWDLVADQWMFVAIRKGDGVHECKVIGQHATAKEARAQCEADVYNFHWDARDVAREQGFSVKGKR